MEENNIKGLWISDAVAATGFARVAHSIIGSLPTEYEIHHLGINYFGDPHPYKHKIYPASLGGDVYGLGRLESMVLGLRPDFIFMINDPWVISMYLNELRKIKKELLPPIVVYFPVDAKEHSPSFYQSFDLVKEVCVYTNFGKDVILDTKSPNISSNKIHIIPHGISSSIFYPMDSTFSRQALYPQERMEEFLNSFIVFNGNRNQPRKRMDITMWAFREFQKDKPDVKLYLHMGIQDLGYNVAELAVRYGFDNKLILSTTSNQIPSLPEERLNIVYNACDVGINTSIGEGWGLVNWEHAATGKLQIMPNHSALSEIWENENTAILLPTIMDEMVERVNTVGRVVDLNSLVEALNWAYDDWKNNGADKIKAIGQKGYELTKERKFKWKSVADKFDYVIKKAIK
jgi:glycosyltransferase involved in cell wall biosynthesis